MSELMGGGPVTTHWDLTQEMSDEAWRRMMGVHLDGTFFCTREALRLMARKNRGAIINMSSVAALMGLEAAVHYSAAKGGHLTRDRAGESGGGMRGACWGLPLLPNHRRPLHFWPVDSAGWAP